jgi:hypothetical protein
MKMPKPDYKGAVKRLRKLLDEVEEKRKREGKAVRQKDKLLMSLKSHLKPPISSQTLTWRFLIIHLLKMIVMKIKNSKSPTFVGFLFCF